MTEKEYFDKISSLYRYFCSGQTHHTLSGRKILEALISLRFQKKRIRADYSSFVKEKKWNNQEAFKTKMNFLFFNDYLPKKLKEDTDSLWTDFSNDSHFGNDIEIKDKKNIKSLNELLEWFSKKYNHELDFLITPAEMMLQRKKNDEAQNTTRSGHPKLELYDNLQFYQNQIFTFEELKLSETRVEKFMIKNGGGGTLDAEVTSNADWIQITPKKIHQSNLPQELTITINPSKDDFLINGSIDEKLVTINYSTSGKAIEVKIPIKLNIEGYRSLIQRYSKHAGLISLSLAVITIIVFVVTFKPQDIELSLVGILISIGCIIFGNWWYYFRSEIDLSDKMRGVFWLSLGYIIALIIELPALLLLLTIQLTLITSRKVFKEFPLQKKLSSIIPVVFYTLFWIYFTVHSTKYSNRYYSENTRQNYPNQKQENEKAKKDELNNIITISKIGYVIAEDYANIRSGTSTNHNILSTKNRGEQLILTGKSRDSEWYKVLYNGNQTGFVSAKLIGFSLENVNIEATNKKPEKLPLKENTSPINNGLILDESFMKSEWNITKGFYKGASYSFSQNNSGIFDSNQGWTKGFSWSIQDNKSVVRISFSSSDTKNWKMISMSSTELQLQQKGGRDKMTLQRKTTDSQITNSLKLQEEKQVIKNNTIEKSSPIKVDGNYLFGMWTIQNGQYKGAKYGFGPENEGVGYFQLKNGTEYQFDWEILRNSSILRLIMEDRSIHYWRLSPLDKNTLVMDDNKRNLSRTLKLNHHVFEEKASRDLNRKVITNKTRVVKPPILGQVRYQIPYGTYIHFTNLETNVTSKIHIVGQKSGTYSLPIGNYSIAIDYMGDKNGGLLLNTKLTKTIKFAEIKEGKEYKITL